MAESNGGPPDGPTRPKRTRMLLGWSIAATAFILVFAMWSCSSAFLQGRRLSNEAVSQFHKELNLVQYDRICDGADEGLHRPDYREELLKVLQTVHTKLGRAQSEHLTNMEVKVTAKGTLVNTTYTTTFDHGPAEEHFTWKKRGNNLKLYGYHIESNALFSN